MELAWLEVIKKRGDLGAYCEPSQARKAQAEPSYKRAKKNVEVRQGRITAGSQIVMLWDSVTTVGKGHHLM